MSAPEGLSSELLHANALAKRAEAEFRDTIRREAEHRSVRRICDVIAAYVRSFQAQLKPDQEVGLTLVNFGQAITIHVRALRYEEPYLIIFSGETDSREPVRLIQHFSQLNFALVAVPLQGPKRPIGFPVPDPSTPQQTDPITAGATA